MKPKLPLLLPREHVAFLCRLPAYRRAHKAFLTRLDALIPEMGKSPSFGSTEWLTARKRVKEAQQAFAESWGLKEPVDPRKENVDMISLVMPHTDARVGDPVEIIRWRKAGPDTRSVAVRSALRGLHICINESDLIGGRRLRLEVDLSYPWEGALEDEIKAVVLAARKLAGAPRKVDGEMFAERVRAASRAIKSKKPSVVAVVLEPWTYKATKKGNPDSRSEAAKRWKALQQRVSDILNS